MMVLSNFVPVSVQNRIISAINSDDFPWFYDDNIYQDPGSEIKLMTPRFDKSFVTSSVRLSHMAYYDGIINSQYFEMFREILDFLEFDQNIVVDEIHRMRVRRTFQVPGHDETKYTIPHVDYPSDTPFKTLIYYVDDSDGDTVMFDKWFTGDRDAHKESLTITERIPPVKGNAVFFDGLRFHAGNCPVNCLTRTIINYDFTTRVMP
jgi:hypothetical protein